VLFIGVDLATGFDAYVNIAKIGRIGQIAADRLLERARAINRDQDLLYRIITITRFLWRG
jgi:hypothetical protein